jgi:ABC-type transport system substrate-binding protein
MAMPGRALAQTPVPQPEAGPVVPRPMAVRVGLAAFPETFDPLAARSLEHLWLNSLLYDAPARWNADGDILPSLGLGWSISAWGHALEIALRPDARFHDGSPLTADDVRFTLERLRFSGPSVPDQWRMEHVWRIESVDPGTVRVILDEPDASFPSSLAAPVLSVMREIADPARARGGTGPYSIGYTADNVIIFRRNPWFWQIGRPRIESLHLREIPGDTERSTALVTGAIDLMPNVPLLDVPMLQADPSVRLVGGPSNHLCLLHVNLQGPHLQDARVRRVLSAAIDRARLVQVATAGQAESGALLFPDRSWARGEIGEPAHRDAAATRADLAGLGIRNDLRLHLITDNADATLANTAVVLQEQLAYCGIALTVELLDGPDLAEAIRLGAYDLLAGYTRPWRDPHELVRPLLASDGAGNRSGYAEPQVDGLVRGAAITPDLPTRQERYARLQARVLEDMPVIVLFRPYYFDAMTQRLTGYQLLQPVTARGLMPATMQSLEP